VRWMLRSHAWSPDNKRIVYQDTQDRRVKTLDVDTGDIQDFGPGRHPTWSPDGRFIALQQAGTVGNLGLEGGDTDYELIALDQPIQRIPLLSNRRGLFFSRRFTHEALWTPNPRYLVMFQLENEFLRARVLDRSTGRLCKTDFIPPGVTATLGGRR
ncbi:MAG TPA: hypothetical protein VFX28_16665, partial [Methylomirabilota bacterium]|nr:hypothetical protein [Methylomirabilota bacterium]